MNPKVKDTSLEAYKKLKLTEAQERVLDVFLAFRGGQMNYKEIILYTGNPNDQKRLNELVAIGRIKQTGKRDGCAAFSYVWSKAEREKLRQLHANKKPEMERFAAWMHNQRLKQHGKNWYGKIGDSYGEFTHAQLIKQFRQSEKLTNQIIW